MVDYLLLAEEEKKEEEERQTTIPTPTTPTPTTIPVIIVGVAADSGCGKSTFVRRLTSILLGADNNGNNNHDTSNVALQNEHGKEGQSESTTTTTSTIITNTIVSELVTVICLDDYHIHDRQGRQNTGFTALNPLENNFDLLYEHVQALKEGKTISKPIYNHIHGTLDAPEIIQPTPIIILEGLHPMYDERVRQLLDVSLYLDISPQVKLDWKIQRDQTERGHSYESILASMEARKSDFDAYIDPQKKLCDMILQVLPTEMSLYNKDKEQQKKNNNNNNNTTSFRVRCIQRLDVPNFNPTFLLPSFHACDEQQPQPQEQEQESPNKIEGGLSDSNTSCFELCAPACHHTLPTTSGRTFKLCSQREIVFGNDCQVLEMDGNFNTLQDLFYIESVLLSTNENNTPKAKFNAGELTQAMMLSLTNDIASATTIPGSNNGTGLFQTLAAFTIRDLYETKKANTTKANKNMKQKTKSYGLANETKAKKTTVQQVVAVCA